MTRLHWGCGPEQFEGWVHSDVEKWLPTQEHVGDLLRGLPFDDQSFDMVVTHHALQMVGYHDLVPALRELRRVLKRGGWLRLGLPDLLGGVERYFTGDPAGFMVDDDTERTDGGKLCAWITWYSTARSVFVPEFVSSLLNRAGFGASIVMPCGQTMSPDPQCAALDNRPGETFYVEAQR